MQAWVRVKRSMRRIDEEVQRYDRTHGVTRERQFRENVSADYDCPVPKSSQGRCIFCYRACRKAGSLPLAVHLSMAVSNRRLESAGCILLVRNQACTSQPSPASPVPKSTTQSVSVARSLEPSILHAAAPFRPPRLKHTPPSPSSTPSSWKRLSGSPSAKPPSASSPSPPSPPPPPPKKPHLPTDPPSPGPSAS